MPTLNVKWGREKYTVDANTEDPPFVFKSQLFALTGVQPDRQKLVIKGKILPDESWEGIAIAEGLTIMMMGSADAIPQAPVLTSEDQSGQGQKAKELPMPLGLKNLGNTCYMNSVLQSLQTIPELSECLEKYSGADDNQSTRLLKSLRETFRFMQNKNPSSLIPMSILFNLHAQFPQFATVGERGEPQQQDANECFTELLRVVLSGIKGIKPTGWDASIESFFRGKYSVELKNMENPDEPAQNSHEDFYQLSCFLSQEVKYVQTGLKEKLTEEIEKHSPSLDRNAKYQKKITIDRLPAYVSVQMVRFFYKENVGTNAKILKDVKFPLVLDLHDLCTPKLQERCRPHRDAFKADEDAKLERLRRKKLEDPATREDDGEPLPFSFEDDPGSNNSAFYELQAVITHKGRSSDSGHYVAWVRIKGDKWAMCDDDEVHEITSQEVLKLSGGGDWHTAYVLLYGPRICHKDKAEAEENVEAQNVATTMES
ncbi:unnamed protein product, partial [Mesorhabditis belari]|uniref:Ubiquitin carboxyl-terminal hydrolase n=1 Tax=Mesorhabditis belari TaxID=2138241 RepID=A0AAF3EA43_9BILA